MKTSNLIYGGIALASIIALTSKRKEIMEYYQDFVWDGISKERISKLHPAIREKVSELIVRVEKELGIKLRVVQGLRTWEDQSKLYAQGRSAPGKIVTMAKPGDSFHNYGLAVDLAEIRDGKVIWNTNWAAIVKIAKQIGFAWGGEFKNLVDKPHFEMAFGRTIAQVKQLHTNKMLDNGYIRFAA